MGVLYVLLALLFLLAGLVGWIFLIVEAFRDEIWKGVVGLLCGLYLFYYAIFDWEHENKWPIVLLAFGGSAIAGGFAQLARGG